MKHTHTHKHKTLQGRFDRKVEIQLYWNQQQTVVRHEALQK